MPRLPLPQHAAKTWSRIAMGAAALCFVGAVTVFILPAPRIAAGSGAQADVGPAAPPEPAKNPAEGIRADWPSLVQTIDDLNSPEIAQFKEELRRRSQAALLAQADQETGEKSPQPSGGFAPPWRFLGLVVEPGGYAALVEIDQRQSFVRSGHMSADGYEVVRVEPTQIVVKKGRSEYTVPRHQSERGRSLATGAVFPTVPRNPASNRSQFDPTISDEAADVMEMRRRRAAGEEP